MEHITERVDFEGIKSSSEDNSDLSKSDSLKRYVRTYYDADFSKFRRQDFDHHWEEYQGRITAAISSNDLEGLNILWKGIYYHDRDNPDFEFDTYTAAEFGNLRTFQHVLYGYWYYHQLNHREQLDCERLVNLARKNPNPEVLSYIETIKQFVEDNVFENVDPIESPPEFYCDLDLASNSSKCDVLKQYVVTYYGDLEKNHRAYQSMITAAICSNNIKGVDILWRACYHSNNPDFELDTYTAAEFSDLKMFQYIINGYRHYPRCNPINRLNYERLVDLGRKNPDHNVLLYIETLRKGLTEM